MAIPEGIEEHARRLVLEHLRKGIEFCTVFEDSDLQADIGPDMSDRTMNEILEQVHNRMGELLTKIADKFEEEKK